MNKLWWNRVVDFLLWISICLMLSTGFIIRYRLPPGSKGGHGMEIWGWSRHEWGDLHTWMAYTVCVFVVVHIVLHWQWLMRTAWPRIKWPVIAGLILGILLAVSAWLIPVEITGSSGRGEGGGSGMDGRSGRWEIENRN
ncbi:MAG TPA: DUF4405 domain-containing protein [Kiritimatiellia bacterium]|nr:DUF4405 domain-containing protein [Kiritimatiellia bacterium]